MTVKKKKMTDEELIYEELRKSLNKAPLSFPRTPDVMKVLKFYYPTVEDAEIARFVECPLVGGNPKTADDVAKEAGQDAEKARVILDRLVSRGSLVSMDIPGEPAVRVYVHWGSWLCSDFLGQLDLGNPKGVIYRNVINKWYDEGYLMEWGASKYPAWRTLTIGEHLDGQSKVLDYELAEGLIKASERVSICYCNCRVRHRKCDHRIDNCIILGPLADVNVEIAKKVPGARPSYYVSHEEALQILHESFKEGLVACTSNHANPPYNFICMCCPCCCHILGGYAKNITGWGNPYHLAKSNYKPKQDEGKCNLCGKCIEICPVKAMWRHYPHKDDLSDDYVFFEEDRCIGCGICAYNCPKGALTMTRVSDIAPEPDIVSAFKRMDKERRH